MFHALRLDGLWRHPDFLRLWAGHTVSLAGSLVSRFALPLVAIFTLDASPGEVALIRMADALPGVVLGLVAGVWVDRLKRRPLMIWADIGRAVLLAWIPLAAIFGLLGIWQLFAVVMAAGTLTAVFEVANRSYLPTLIPRERLVEANAKLSGAGSVVEVGAFGFAGLLVQVLTAPIAVLLDAVSFVLSAVCLGAIRAPEPPPAPEAHEQSTLAAIREGLRLVFHNPILRGIALAFGMLDLFLHIWVTMLLVFLTRDLGLEPLVFGILFAVGGVCSFLGALVAEPIERRFGIGPTMIVTFFLSAASLLSVPLAAGPFLLVIFLVGLQQLADLPATVNQIHEQSLIQASVPDEALGRVTASLRVIDWSAMLLGTMLGGVLGELIGPRSTMLIGACGALPAVLFLYCSPLRHLRRLPTPTVSATG
ncbi:MAG: MFS transporter [Chloroflexi bacterium]|nr:MFS transporter [Chloroflexota bacterium]